MNSKKNYLKVTQKIQKKNKKKNKKVNNHNKKVLAINND